MDTTLIRRSSLRALAGFGAAALTLAIGVPAASADHADEKIEVSKTTDIAEGDTLTINFSGFDPAGKPVKAVIAGQGKLVTIPDKLSFEEYGTAPTAVVGADGSGTVEIIAIADHGVVQDGSTLNCLTQQCWVIVVQEPFLPQPNYAVQAVTFVGGSVTPETTVPDDETPDTTAVAAETTVAETTTTVAATTEVPETTVADDADESTDNAEDDEGGSGALYAIIAAVVVALGAGGFFLSKKKSVVG